jgi:hypothetical protein
MFDQLLTLGRTAFEQKHFDAAYHILAASLHMAEQDGDEAALELVEAEANRQIAWIDANAPSYRHSTQSTIDRGQKQSILSLLASQASTRVRILQHQKHVQGMAEEPSSSLAAVLEDQN